LIGRFELLLVADWSIITVACRLLDDLNYFWKRAKQNCHRSR